MIEGASSSPAAAAAVSDNADQNDDGDEDEEYPFEDALSYEEEDYLYDDDDDDDDDEIVDAVVAGEGGIDDGVATGGGDDESVVEKTLAFLVSDSIADLPPDAKRRYLETRVGLTRRQIDAAMKAAAGTTDAITAARTDGTAAVDSDAGISVPATAGNMRDGGGSGSGGGGARDGMRPGGPRPDVDDDAGEAGREKSTSATTEKGRAPTRTSRPYLRRNDDGAGDDGEGGWKDKKNDEKRRRHRRREERRRPVRRSRRRDYNSDDDGSEIYDSKGYRDGGERREENESSPRRHPLRRRRSRIRYEDDDEDDYDNDRSPRGRHRQGLLDADRDGDRKRDLSEYDAGVGARGPRLSPPPVTRGTAVEPLSGTVAATLREDPFAAGAETPPPSSSLILPALAGGFSLGVLCLSAVRWLNGGDFVLFPPPSVRDDDGGDCRRDGRLETIEEGMSARRSAEEVNGDGDGGGENGEDSPQEEDEEKSYAEDIGPERSIVGDDPAIDDDAINDDHRTTRPYERERERDDQLSERTSELTAEIRGLTSALTLHREVTERASREAKSREGRAATDDAMGFLRSASSSALSARTATVAKDKEKKKEKKCDANVASGGCDVEEEIWESAAELPRLSEARALLAEATAELRYLRENVVLMSSYRGRAEDKSKGEANGGNHDGEEVVESRCAGDGNDGKTEGEGKRGSDGDDDPRDKDHREIGRANGEEQPPIGEDGNDVSRIDAVLHKIEEALALVGGGGGGKTPAAGGNDEDSGGDGGSPDGSSLDAAAKCRTAAPADNDGEEVEAKTSLGPSATTPDDATLKGPTVVPSSAAAASSKDGDSKHGGSGATSEKENGNSNDDDDNHDSGAKKKKNSKNEILENTLRTLATSNSAAELKPGAQMLYLYCLNVSRNPDVPRYRKIYTNNSNFRTRVGNLTGARDVLKAVGFEERENFFEWATALDQRPSKEIDSARSGDGGGNDEEEDSEDSAAERLKFALVALEMMKNGTTNLLSSNEPGDEPSLLSGEVTCPVE